MNSSTVNNKVWQSNCLERRLPTPLTTVLDSSDAYAAADAAIKQQPELLFHKIIAHFCHLFDCKETAAIFPTMNRLFLTVQEQSNFIRCVRSTLRLGKPIFCAANLTNASAAQRRRPL